MAWHTVHRGLGEHRRCRGLCRRRITELLVDDAVTASMGGRNTDIDGSRRLEEGARRTDLDEPEKQAEVAGQTVVQTRPTPQCSNAKWRCRDKSVGISG